MWVCVVPYGAILSNDNYFFDRIPAVTCFTAESYFRLLLV